MISAWRNFKIIFSRPLFIIIFRPKISFFVTYSILTGDTRVEFVIYWVLNMKLFDRCNVNCNVWMFFSSQTALLRQRSLWAMGNDFKRTGCFQQIPQTHHLSCAKVFIIIFVCFLLYYVSSSFLKTTFEILKTE